MIQNGDKYINFFDIRIVPVICKTNLGEPDKSFISKPDEASSVALILITYILSILSQLLNL